MRQLNYRVKPSPNLNGQITIPGDKSISHRAIMLGAIAEGAPTRITGFLFGDDCLNTLKIFQQLGIEIEADRIARTVVVHGQGLTGLKAASEALDCGNSGTSMRLLMGLLAGQSFASTLIGDHSLMQRPMQRVALPLQHMGALIELKDQSYAPVKITPVPKLQNIRYELPVASAQLKSAILLASLYTKGRTEIIEPKSTRDHSERMLQQFGCAIEKNQNCISFSGGQVLKSCSIQVPADISSAAFFIVATLIAPQATLRLNHIGFNPSRHAIVEMLQAMGANIEIHNLNSEGFEPTADLIIRSSQLKALSYIKPEWIPIAIDEMPIFMIACALAQGTTRIEGLRELRFKESDRLHAMAEGLTRLGIQVTEFEDGIEIVGGQFQSGTINSYGDHRIAMAFIIAGAAAHQSITVENCHNVATSFPEFFELAEQIGLNLERLAS